MATMDPSAPPGRAPAGRFRSFIEKSVGKALVDVVVVVSCGTSEGRKKTRQDGALEGERRGETGHRAISLLARKERPSISPSEMTIRRGWLGKRLFIARNQGSSRSALPRLTWSHERSSANAAESGETKITTTTTTTTDRRRECDSEEIATHLQTRLATSRSTHLETPTATAGQTLFGTTPREQTNSPCLLINRGESVTILFTRVSTREKLAPSAPSDT